MPKAPMLSFRATDEFLAEVDRCRGDVPRSAFLRRAVVHYIQALDDRASTKPKPTRRAPTQAQSTARSAPGHLPRCTCALCKPTKARK